MAPIIGIDLGTTNSLCSLFVDGEPQLVPNAFGKPLTPSVVGILDDGRLLVGEPARELAITHPERTVAWFKRWMGTDKKTELGGREFTPEELSSFVLRSLKADVDAYLGFGVVEAVITVPAYFNELQRAATKVAGELAGLTVRRILNEPTAAALTYGLLDRDADKKLLVFDLGGGTFDVTVMEVFEGTLEITASAGENHLGGEDFTDRLVEWALRHEGKTLEITEMKQPLLVARLRQECERAKVELSGVDRWRVRMPRPDGTVDDECKSYELTAEELVRESARIIERLAVPLARALRDSGATVADIDEVILVGGATRMPVVREFVFEQFGRFPLSSIDPDEVVALGASVQAALIVDDRSVTDIVMTDVCPFTLGIEIAKTLGTQVREGYFMPVIHRNTTIPVSREEIVYTVHPGQTKVVVKVYQGEARKVTDNVLLGEFEVSGIPPGPEGKDISIRFTYDINGILEVEVVIDETGQKFASVFTHHVKNLTPEEIQKAVASLQEIKFYPREDLDNRNLLLFAERIVGQISPFQRQPLEEALDFYEAALAGTDRALFESARANLISQLSMLGHPYAP